MRASCKECVLKHLGQASILMDEANLGYPLHKWLAIGHLAEAESESFALWPVAAARIRDARKAYNSGEDVDIMRLIEVCSTLTEVDG